LLSGAVLHDESGTNILDSPRAAGSDVQTTALMFLLFEEFFIELF